MKYLLGWLADNKQHGGVYLIRVTIKFTDFIILQCSWEGINIAVETNIREEDWDIGKTDPLPACISFQRLQISNLGHLTLALTLVLCTADSINNKISVSRISWLSRVCTRLAWLRPGFKVRRLQLCYSWLFLSYLYFTSCRLQGRESSGSIHLRNLVPAAEDHQALAWCGKPGRVWPSGWCIICRIHSAVPGGVRIRLTQCPHRQKT